MGIDEVGIDKVGIDKVGITPMYNVLAVLSMADMVCLACMQKLWSP